MYRGIRVLDTNDWGNRYTVNCVVLVDEQPLPMSDLARRKSLDGYEWGYGGSGPSALSHSILAYELGVEIADRLYQAFKWTVIAQLPRDGEDDQVNTWTLTSEQIRAWYEQQER